MDTFGKRFKEERLNKRLTQEQLADKFNLKKSSISRYENDKQMPEVNLLRGFSDFFGVSVDYLIGNEESRQEDDFLNEFDDLKQNGKFTNEKSAKKFLSHQKQLMAFGMPELTDKEYIDFANDILTQIELVSHKYKNKNKK